MLRYSTRLASAPLAITSPVGNPVGEPPGGSIDTASAVVCRKIFRSGTGTETASAAACAACFYLLSLHQIR